MEINLTPSLDCDAPIDIKVKSNLISNLFTLVGIRNFERSKILSNYLKSKVKKNTN